MAEARRGSTLCPGELFIAELERDCPSPPARLSKSYGPSLRLRPWGWGQCSVPDGGLDTSFVLDGEAVLLGVDGRSDFDGLHSRRHDAEVEFYAFDILVSDGEDVRKLPLSMRKARLARLLARRVDGIFLSDFAQGEIGPDLLRHACLMGLGGMVSKHRESTYRGGRFRRWIKVKNRQHPAFSRVQDPF